MVYAKFTSIQFQTMAVGPNPMDKGTTLHFSFGAWEHLRLEMTMFKILVNKDSCSQTEA